MIVVSKRHSPISDIRPDDEVRSHSHRPLTPQILFQLFRPARWPIIERHRHMTRLGRIQVLVIHTLICKRTDALVVVLVSGISGPAGLGRVGRHGDIGDLNGGELVEPCAGNVGGLDDLVDGWVVGCSSAYLGHLFVCELERHIGYGVTSVEDLLFCRLKRWTTSSGSARLICLTPPCRAAGAATAKEAKSSAGVSVNIAAMMGPGGNAALRSLYVRQLPGSKAGGRSDGSKGEEAGR